ncbi:MAG TPA: hypothetical protein QF509_00975 [Rhodospirillales bacterium]|nr:hypothetical protein [Rhodospirillales bacterium]
MRARCGITQKKTELANLLARCVHDLDEETLERLLAEIKRGSG